MLLADLLDHLARRFPDGATVLLADITLVGNGHPDGLLETVSYDATAADDEDGPDNGEEVEPDQRVSLRLVT